MTEIPIDELMRAVHAKSLPLKHRRPAGRTRRAIEWPTVAVAAAIYATFGLLTWYYHALPWWFMLPMAAWVVAWHGSLQHEIVHGHPTRWSWVNELIVLPSLWLWLPYRLYRDTHVAHHHDQRLTDPLDDPESYYKTAEQWSRYNRIARAVFWINNTVAGRLLLGPLIAVWQTWKTQLPKLLRGERTTLAAWALHALGCALVLLWVVWLCRIPLGDYLLLFVYPGTALTLLRSFAEHRAAVTPERRTVIVETAWPLALLYLNNNLHALHHQEPWLPWYRLPRRYRARRVALLAANGDYRFRGYAEIIARYLLWPKESPVHPGDSPSQPRSGLPGAGAGTLPSSALDALMPRAPERVV